MTVRHSSFLGFVSLLALASPALGQQASAANDQDSLDTIVVSARRTTENLQSVPIAVTVVSGEELAKR